MKIHAGIVTYMTAISDLKLCLDSLYQQTLIPDTIWIHDNSPRNILGEWIRQNYPAVRFHHHSENIGYGRAHNLIINACKLQTGDFYLALNSDAWLNAYYLERVINWLNGDEKRGWGMGKLLSSEDTSLIYSLGHAAFRGGYVINIGSGLPESCCSIKTREIWGASGAAVVYKADLITDIQHKGNFFDAHFWLYAEDTDIDWQARKLHWECWLIAEAVGWHRGSQPNHNLKTLALAYRYLSVLKNATWADLIFYNLPLITAHGLARVILNPNDGLAFWWHFLRLAPAMLQERKHQKKNTSTLEIHTWFEWAKHQPTSHPKTWRERVREYQHQAQKNGSR